MLAFGSHIIIFTRHVSSNPPSISLTLAPNPLATKPVRRKEIEEGRKPTIGLLPSPPSAEAQSYPCRPCSSLEEQHGEDDAKGETEGGAYEEG